MTSRYNYFSRLTFLKEERFKRGLHFLSIFSAVLALGFITIHFFPENLKHKLCWLVSFGAVNLAKVLGLAASIEADKFMVPGYMIKISGFEVAIIFECVASSYIVLFTAAVLAYPVTIKKKLKGLAAGLFILILVNLLRIVSVGWIGANYPDYLDMVHRMIWEGLMIILVAALWAGWLKVQEDAFRLDAVLVRKFIMVVVLTIMTIITYSTVSENYLKMLVAISNGVLDIMYFWSGSLSLSGGGVKILLFGGKVFTLTLPTIISFYAYAVLVIFFVEPKPLTTALSYFVCGSMVIFLLHLFTVVITCLDVLDGTYNEFLMLGTQTLCLFSPFLAWLLVNFLLKNKKFMSIRPENAGNI